MKTIKKSTKKTITKHERLKREYGYQAAYKLWEKITPLLIAISVLFFFYSIYYINYKS